MSTPGAMSVPTRFGKPSCHLVVADGADGQQVPISKLPFKIGRRPDNDLVLSEPRVSREHAVIAQEETDYLLIDLGSKHGTFVNGQRIVRHCLQPNDRLAFGARDGTSVLFAPANPSATAELLNKFGDLGSTSDFSKLTLLLEAVRRLNGTRVMEDVLLMLLELTLRLTRAERAYIFLRESNGDLRLAAARNAQGDPLAEDATLSHSILNEASNSGCEFLLTDTSRYDQLDSHQSIVAFALRTVICLPLCGHSRTEHPPAGAPGGNRDVRGVLYLDSHFASRELTGISHDVLRALAREAAALLENAGMAQAEQAARYYQQELAIAASIQQNLMGASIPELPFAAVRARSIPCREIGGDFFDAIPVGEGLALVVADVCGKGISAALLASTLQGLIYSQLMARVPLANIAAAANTFLCQKRLGPKYATVLLAFLEPSGELEMVNCGHVPPILVSPPGAGRARFLEEANLPVGLFPLAMYESTKLRLTSGECLLVYTDGITEAANQEEFFGGDRLRHAATAAMPLDAIFADLKEFCPNPAADDDCTVLELRFTGSAVSGG